MNIRFDSQNRTITQKSLQKTSSNCPSLKSTPINFTGRLEDKALRKIEENRKILSNITIWDRLKYLKNYLELLKSECSLFSVTPQRAHKLCKSVFVRPDLALEDSVDIVKKYKNAEKLEKKYDYARAVFASALENYGFAPDSKIKLTLSTRCFGGFWDDLTGNVMLSYSLNRKGMFDCIHHELRHAFQSFVALSDKPVEFVQAFISRVEKLGADYEINDYCKNNFGMSFFSMIKTTPRKEKLQAAMQKDMKAIFGSTPVRDFEGKREFVENVINGTENYVPSSYSLLRYKINPLESDAYKAGNDACKLLKVNFVNDNV